MIIHHIQPLHKSSPENSLFLPKYPLRHCDEKGESSAAKVFFVFIRGIEKVAKSSVQKKGGHQKTFFKPNFIFPLEAYLDICFTSP